jgi:hypothetical protein
VAFAPGISVRPLRVVLCSHYDPGRLRAAPRFHTGISASANTSAMDAKLPTPNTNPARTAAVNCGILIGRLVVTLSRENDGVGLMHLRAVR